MRIDQIAINSVSTAADTPLPDRLSAYAAAGFRQVEFALPQVKAWLGAGHNLSDLALLLERLDLRCIGGFETTVCCFGSEAERNDNAQLQVSNARLISELGGGVLVAGTDGPPNATIDTLDQVGRRCREVVERIPDNVSLAIEFNWSPIVRSLRSAVRVAQAAAHPRVGVLFDPAHYHCTSSKLEDLTAEAVGHILHVHVDDMRDKPGEWSHCNADRVLPGEGCLPLREMIRRFEAHGYRGRFSVEMFSADLWAMPTREAAERMHASMRSLCD